MRLLLEGTQRNSAGLSAALLLLLLLSVSFPATSVYADFTFGGGEEAAEEEVEEQVEEQIEETVTEETTEATEEEVADSCLLYTSPSPRDGLLSRMPSSA